MSASTLPPQPTQATRTMTTPTALPTHRRSIFPPIPAPLQRLFDLVPLVVYPPNALPGDDVYDQSPVADDSAALPTLFVFIDPVDAARGRASFNPTCLKWQAYLRFAGVPVRLAASSNHSSPTGALPFLQPPREPEPPVSESLRYNSRQRIRLPAPSRPVPTSEFAKYAKKIQTQAQPEAKTTLPIDSLAAIDPRAPAYQALLDTSLRRAWLHAVYLDDGNNAQPTVASRLYADAASSSMFVRASLAGQLQAAAASEVWGAAAATAAAAPSAFAVAHIYKDAAVALSALQSVLEDNDSETAYFFGSKEPTIFDAAVFSYTHLLLEDDDTSTPRFQWHNSILADLVRSYPLLVQHRNTIAARYWADGSQEKPAETSGVADSVSWVKVEN